MPIQQKLSEEEILEEIKDIPLWDYKNPYIIREIVATNFVAAIGIVNAIAILSEKTDHHPDILIYGWNKIRITLITHSINALSKLDLLFILKIDFEAIFNLPSFK